MPIRMSFSMFARRPSSAAAPARSSPGLPQHLRLGINLDGMREWLESLPPDAVDQVNRGIPLVNGEPKFPTNAALNG
jgi:hypothetical protein